MIEAFSHELQHGLWQVASAADHYLRNTYTGHVLANFWDLAAQLCYFVVLGALGADARAALAPTL